jgi:hypothetical protein
MYILNINDATINVDAEPVQAGRPQVHRGGDAAGGVPAGDEEPEGAAAAALVGPRLRGPAEPGDTVSYVDNYTPLLDMVTHPDKYGFTQTGLGCCGTGMMEMGALCTSLLPQCKSPEQYMFFDSVHPTQATYKAMADQIIKAHIS